MTTKEIRDAAVSFDAAFKSPEMKSLPLEDQDKALLMLAGTLAFSMICEVAAQLAEVNENLAKLVKRK